MKYIVEREHNYGTFVVYKLSWFGMRKEPIARLQDKESATKLVQFITDPLYHYRNNGCTELTRGWLANDLKRIARNLYDL